MAVYKRGDYVEVLEDNKWILGYILGEEDKPKRHYRVQLMTDGKIVTHGPKSMRPGKLHLGDEDDMEAPIAPAAVKVKRFATVKDEALQQLELNAKARATHKQTAWGLKIFKEWLLEVGEPLNFEDKEIEALALLLKRFYAEVRQKDGREYSKKSLLCVRGSLQRHLSQSPINKPYSIIGNPMFKAANDVFVGHIKGNKAAGLDVTESYPSITQADKLKLYTSRTLSHDTPKTLQMKAYYEMSLHFGRRAREGLHALKQADFKFRQDENGIEYATLGHNPTEKNHQGLSQGGQEHDQRMYGTGDENCPLKTLKCYLDKLSPASPSFFQTPKHKNYRLSSIWYTRSSVGLNTIGKFMQEISTDAGLSKVYSNHSIRSTCVNTLRAQGIPSRDIKAVTGHKSEASIESYSKTPDSLRRNMSNVLAGINVPSTATTASSTATSNVQFLNVDNTPKGCSLFGNSTFSNCTINVNYK